MQVITIQNPITYHPAIPLEKSFNQLAFLKIANTYNISKGFIQKFPKIEIQSYQRRAELQTTRNPDIAIYNKTQQNITFFIILKPKRQNKKA